MYTYACAYIYKYIYTYMYLYIISQTFGISTFTLCFVTLLSKPQSSQSGTYSYCRLCDTKI